MGLWPFKREGSGGSQRRRTRDREDIPLVTAPRANAAPVAEVDRRPAASLASEVGGQGMPRFTMNLEGAALRETVATTEQRRRLDRLRAAFSPTQPQRAARLFAGRRDQLERVIRAIEQERAHVVLFADRGRGKTSLSNMVADLARSAGYMVGRYACAASSTYDEIMRGLARDLPASLLATPAVAAGRLEGCEAALPEGPVGTKDVAALPGRLTGRHLVLMIDEFDRVEDLLTRTRLADTIKHVSDRGVSLSFVIVGVSDSLEQLIGQHPSIQRNVVGVALPLMKTEEIERLVQLGAAAAGIGFNPRVVATIASLARGVPYFAQLISLHASRSALERSAEEVNDTDLELAVDRAVAEADPRVVGIYEQLLVRHGGGGVRDLLFAIATGELEPIGAFVARPAVGGQAMLIGSTRRFEVDRKLWHAVIESGVIRACQGGAPDRFVFVEATMLNYILLRQARERNCVGALTAHLHRNAGKLEDGPPASASEAV